MSTISATFLDNVMYANNVSWVNAYIFTLRPVYFKGTNGPVKELVEVCSDSNSALDSGAGPVKPPVLFKVEIAFITPALPIWKTEELVTPPIFI